MPTLKAPLKVVLVWHNDSPEAKKLGEELNAQLATSVTDPMMPGLGLDVRTLPLMPQEMGYDKLKAELEPGFSTYERVAIFALIGKTMKDDATAQEFLLWLQSQCADTGEMHRFFPISLEDEAFGVDGRISNVNFIRLQDTEAELRDEQVTGRVCHELCRMLTDFPRYSGQEGTASRLPPVKLFISHTKKDNGLTLAKNIARWFATEPPFKTFFDASEIPAGEPFPDVINENVRESTILILQSDQYSTRYWCLEEVLKAKEYDRPLVGVYCLQNGEARSFPYLGNIPTLSWNGQLSEQAMMALITRAVARETLKFLFFKKLCYFTYQTTPEEADGLGIVISARPPEMAVLARIRAAGNHRTYLYPDPAISPNEEKFLLSAFPEFTLSTINRFQWPQPEPSGMDTGKSSRGPAIPKKKAAPRFNTRDIAIDDELSRGAVFNLDTGADDLPAMAGDEPDDVHDAMPLKGKMIGLSVGESEEMNQMGRSVDDVQSLLNHFIRELILEKASIIYGGDYRGNGFAERIEDLLRNYRMSSDEEGGQLLHNYLAWPYYNAPDEALKASLKGFVDFHTLTLPPDLKAIDPAPPVTDRSPAAAYQVARSFTHMRETMTKNTDARVFMGGKLSGYLGVMPGILEEFLLSVHKGIPVYLTDSFGGATSEIISLLKGEKPVKLSETWQQQNQPAWYAPFVARYNAEAKAKPQLHTHGAIHFDTWLGEISKMAAGGLDAVLNNGLTHDENLKLFAATQPAEITRLVIQGLHKAL